MTTTIAATPEQLAQILKNARKSADLTQTKLAEKAGLLQKTVSALETSTVQNRIETLYKALAALDLEIVIQTRQADETAAW